jgi:hypothetical protein
MSSTTRFAIFASPFAICHSLFPAVFQSPFASRYSLPFRYHCTLSLSKIGSGKVPTGVDEDGASAWSGKTIVPSKIA